MEKQLKTLKCLKPGATQVSGSPEIEATGDLDYSRQAEQNLLMLFFCCFFSIFFKQVPSYDQRLGEFCGAVSRKAAEMFRGLHLTFHRHVG